MSLEHISENRLEDNPNLPRFPKNTRLLNLLYGSSAFSLTQKDLESIAKKVSGYYDYLDLPRSTDNYKEYSLEYDWFVGIIFRKEGHEIVVAFPGKTDETKKGGVANDRSIAYYAVEEVPDELLTELSTDLIEAFSEELSKR